MTAQLSSMEAARSAVAVLVRGGVRDVVVAPGSRSAPLAYALAEAEARGEVRLHVRIDERVAGFTALGLSLGSLRPVPVVTTSGTAVGELLPAVMEANHAAVQLVVISADRPGELRGTGANQTTEQPGLFGSHVRYAADIPAGEDPAGTLAGGLLAARGLAAPDHQGAAGPVHINLAFRDPLFPAADDDGGTAAVPAVTAAAGSREMAVPAPVPGPGPEPSAAAGGSGRTVVVAGHGAGAYAEAFARSQALPLLAEPSSNARFGPNAVGPYRLLLDPLGAGIERVVVFGRPTLSRPVAALLARPDVQTALYLPGPVAWFRRGKRRERIITGPAELALFAGQGPAGWLQGWQRADRAADAALQAVLAGTPELTGFEAAAAVWAHTRGRLVLGSSNTIRDVDLAGRPQPDPQCTVYANRGLAGIDGTTATATGIALGTGGRTRALVGDLTFLHDAGGLLLGAGEAEPALQLVVLNDAGGGIFSLLEHGEVGTRPRYAAAVERLFGTPHQAGIAQLAAAYGLGYRLVEDRAQLEPVLKEEFTGRGIVEIRTDRSGLRRLHARVREAIWSAAGGQP
ncbi:2-succinyl-5-enolpyruvyl-6-hydroxy-3-cyclohexene-1-carboxylic-acid synthase [Arthrobacter mobilis]|uniref:2-succinyl-5-enolpyruvyl-6-hydroxy-3-cyclohexene-1-carboxylate synthase n=1 Tax=Arthrobacter mobilis TaxID=2724944 RepID=A0A7X6HAG3_9MICC|nr:2-succinyl-5-enolpyruvyl-6-hydroxy-3-cyclohexene-1-carboxylic-acid synthase [Arthrobacter mobilis]NKX53471.1 2-succinyl-5-enolpyruvyl-6-hydroxy-3-cyclohexene-1-carboxylic-acid synthase [Arthrobacter mobilis]